MRAALTEPYIHLTPGNDSSPNPRDEPLRVVFDPKGYTADQEVTVIGNLAVRHAQLYPDETIAILAPIFPSAKRKTSIWIIGVYASILSITTFV